MSAPDIVMITVDSLRADHCGFLGDDDSLTPTLDSLAEDGVVYETAIAPGPRTPSSMPEVMTGVRPPVLDAAKRDNWQARWDRIRRCLGRHRTLAERLRDRGYTTVGVTANPWTHGTRFEKGFDTFLEYSGDDAGSNGATTTFSIADRVLRVTGLDERLNWSLKRDWLVQWPQYYDRILSAVDDADRPYFLWVFALDPHQPYLAPRAHREESSTPAMYYANLRQWWTGDDTQPPDRVDVRLRAAYRDAIRSTDAFVRRLLDDLGDPAVVVHADHGEAFGEHGTYGHQPALYEENLHVPLLVANAGQSARVSEPLPLGELPGIVRTIAGGRAFDPNRYTRAFATATTETGEQESVRGRRWKYISGTTNELYDLRVDPAERRNLATEWSDQVRSLRRLLDRERSERRERAAVATAVEGLGGI